MCGIALVIDHACHALVFLQSKLLLYLKELNSLSEYYHESTSYRCEIELIDTVAQDYIDP